MIRHTQTIFVNDPRGIPGDCMRAAVASLLDLPAEAVPHFALFDAPGAWFNAFQLWLAGRDLRIRAMAAYQVTTRCLAIGMSPRGVEHIVVWGPTGLVHDPHPSRAGIEPRQFWAIDPVEPRALCPECVQGKHGNCVEHTLDDNDEWVPCGCPEHGGAR